MADTSTSIYAKINFNGPIFDEKVKRIIDARAELWDALSALQKDLDLIDITIYEENAPTMRQHDRG